MKNEEKIESDIEKAMSFLFDLSNKYHPEQWAHYVVKGENEQDLGGENYCEDCISDAVAKAELYYRKERGKKHLIIRDIERFGYVIRMRNNTPDFGTKMLVMQKGGSDELDYLKKDFEKRYKPTTFGYRYYQLDSTTSHEICGDCGKIISSCVTADEQEIEHWEGLSDDWFIVSEMDERTAYQLYGILDFINQADSEIYKRGHKIALKIIKLNTIKL